ncbi:MAG TPA: M23 family metallopeptidase [Herpetosiphonaceae bacterium]
MRRIILTVALVIGLLGFRSQPIQAQNRSRLFPETGWRVEGRLLEFWEANGGLAVFGLPLGPQQPATTPQGQFITQQFERERLELHPESARPYDVQLGRLGEELLIKQGRDWRGPSAGVQLEGPCRSFAETGRAVCGAFLDYWQRHGLDLGDPGVSQRESLALFGLPLTEPNYETNSSGDHIITQWFERARFEYHPNNPAAFQVLLGRLGAELAGEAVALPTLSVQATPAAVVQGHTTSIQVQIPGAKAVRGQLGDAPVALFSAGDRVWTGLGGVPVLTAPGTLPLRIEADLSDGRTAVYQGAVRVLDARYRTENINLPQEVQDRLDQNREAIVAERQKVNAIWPQATPERLWSGKFILPAQGRISSDFGTRRSYNGGPVDSFHEGLDIANATGTPVVAPARGRVMLAEPDLLVRGGAVILDHGQGVHSGFWHMSAVLVQPGAIVEQGQIIGRIGAKGMVTGPHLHWDVRIGSINVQPQEWIERSWS